MKNVQKIDLGLTGYDELFMNDAERKENKLPRIYDVPISEIDDFPDHPFKVKIDEDIYCNLLEHLLLHVKIAENPSENANDGELPGIGGAINFICKDLNDIYAGKEPADEWRKKVAEKVKDSFEDYIAILRYLWNVVESNPLYKAIITKEMLCVGWDGKVVKEVMNALNGND